MTPDAAVWHGYHAAQYARAARAFRLGLGIRGENYREALHHARLMRAYRRAMQ